MGQKPSIPRPGTTLQVIGAGLPRTGTASFSAALEILLQGPIFHCGTQSTLGPAAQVKTWIQILHHWLSGNPSERPAMLHLLTRQLDGYAAITDSPGSQFIPELLVLYPHAPVVCTVRDPAAWERSMDQVMSLTVAWFLRWVLLPLPGMRHFIPYLHLIADQWFRLYGESRPTQLTYHRHIAWLKETVPPDRLVFFDVRDGWGPLCAALGVDVPADCAFPRVNDSAAIETVANMHVRRGLARWAVILAVGAASVAWVLCW